MKALRWYFFELDATGRKYWRATGGGILGAWSARQAMADAIEQTGAIQRLEGWEPTEYTRAIDKAALAGHVTPDQAAKELCEYAKAHQTLDGFLESRPWINHQHLLNAFAR